MRSKTNPFLKQPVHSQIYFKGASWDICTSTDSPEATSRDRIAVVHLNIMVIAKKVELLSLLIEKVIGGIGSANRISSRRRKKITLFQLSNFSCP